MEKNLEKTGNGKKEKLVRSVKLTTVRDGRKLLSRIINDVRRDRVELKKGQVLGYLLKIYIDSFRNDFEERIEALEKLILENRDRRYTNGYERIQE
ncbi:MAG TPA: hypothetical protein VHT73_16670 [Thermodesulfobacteriota bacterium]|nr:hypothetical protein [Thermodesulfobacteriota bacterium]